MPTLSSSSLLAALNWRYATKKFDPDRRIDDATWNTLEETLVLAPSSYGLQPWKFLVVDDPELKDRLVGASWDQSQPKDASHYVVFAVHRDLGDAHVNRYIERTAEVRGTTAEALNGFRQVIESSLDGARSEGRLDNWQAHQLYIALGQFMTSAALLGVDTCPMEGLDPDQYDEILGLKGTEWGTVVACAAGYRASDDKYADTPKVRFRRDDVIKHL